MTRNDMESDTYIAEYDADPPVASNRDATEDDPVPKDKATTRQIGGAAAAAGITGLILGGPIIAIAAGIGLAACATTNSKTGEVARASGDVVSSAGDRVKQWNQKHRVLEKTGSGIVKGCNWVESKFKPKPT